MRFCHGISLVTASFRLGLKVLRHPALGEAESVLVEAVSSVSSSKQGEEKVPGNRMKDKSERLPSMMGFQKENLKRNIQKAPPLIETNRDKEGKLFNSHVEAITTYYHFRRKGINFITFEQTSYAASIEKKAGDGVALGARGWGGTKGLTDPDIRHGLYQVLSERFYRVWDYSCEPINGIS